MAGKEESDAASKYEDRMPSGEEAPLASISHDDTELRYVYALGHHEGKGVFAIHKDDWTDHFLTNGYNCTATAYFGRPPSTLEQVCHDATVVGVELSLSDAEPKPMDIVRFDSQDAPNVYNRDRYEVFLRPCTATAYPTVIQRYGIQESKELKKYLEEHILLVGPYKDIPGHHSSSVAATLLRRVYEDRENPRSEF